MYFWTVWFARHSQCTSLIYKVAHSLDVESLRCNSLVSFFCVVATSFMEFIVFVNQVFLEAWISETAEFNWCVKSCVLHSDSTWASFVCASSSSSSRTSLSSSIIRGLILSGLTLGSGTWTLPSWSNIIEHWSQDFTWLWKKKCSKTFWY